MKTPRWLDRTLLVGPYFTLCTTPEQFRRVTKRLKVTPDIEFVGKDANARVHHFVTGTNSCSVVCIPHDHERDPNQIIGLLVHEAVHIWQAFIEHIGETAPGHEVEAYAIQNIVQALIAEYSRQTTP